MFPYCQKTLVKSRTAAGIYGRYPLVITKLTSNSLMETDLMNFLQTANSDQKLAV